MEIVSTQRTIERKRVFISLFVPVMFVVLLSIIKVFEWATDFPLYKLGVNPREVNGLVGIIMSPLLHADFGHLTSNAIPLILFGSAMIYFYRNIAYSVFLWVWILDGIGVWIVGRPVYHIGASGLVYGMAAFVFFSGVLRKNRNLLALSLAVIAMYGGLIWGIYPVENGTSWEAHLFGLLAGIFCAIHYKPYGPPNDPIPEWMKREDYFDEVESGEINSSENIPKEENNSSPIKIVYHYEDKGKKKDDSSNG